MDSDRLCDLFPLRDVQLDQNRSPLTDFGSHVDSTMVSIRNATRGCRHGLCLPVENRVSIRQGGCGLARETNCDSKTSPSDSMANMPGSRSRPRDFPG